MFTKLTDTSKAAIFSVLVLCMAVGAALLIRFLDLTPSMGMWTLWSFTPTVAALIMLLVVTRDGYSKEGWKSLGPAPSGPERLVDRLRGDLAHNRGRLGRRVGHPAGLLRRARGRHPQPRHQLPHTGCHTGAHVRPREEIGMRGYLQPQLMSLGRRRALLVVGLVWATWHMPLILLTPVFPVGNKLISLPLFYGTIVAASFFYGYLRIYTGSVWPASIAHAVHNAAWGVLGAFTVTSSPVLVNKYLVGDYGILILVGAVIGAIWVGHMLKSGMDEAQSGAEVPRVDPAPPTAPAAPR